MAQADPLTQRDRLFAATYRCVERFGLGKTTIEDVVKESGVSRATVYRQFPGGRDELLLETVGWELSNYFTRLADHVRDAPDLAELLRSGLWFAHRSIAEHAVLRKIMDTEPERLLRNVLELEYIPLERADECCGFGGSFAVRFPEISGAMVRDKASLIEKTGADTVVATDAGCLMNIAGCLRRRGNKIRALHLAELLAGT